MKTYNDDMQEQYSYVKTVNTKLSSRLQVIQLYKHIEVLRSYSNIQQ